MTMNIYKTKFILCPKNLIKSNCGHSFLKHIFNIKTFLILETERNKTTPVEEPVTPLSNGS